MMALQSFTLLTVILNIEKKVSLYHSLFIICLILMIVFIGISLLFYFAFDISKIIGIKTGLTAKKTIKQLENSNAQSGRLKKNKTGLHKKGALWNTTQTGKKSNYTEILATEPISTEYMKTEEMKKEELLPKTVLLKQAFTIEQDIILIHTDEIIN